jgi:CRISPR/Cas system CMR-associated protein Cmr5 small subunit
MKRFKKSYKSYVREIPNLIVSGGMTRELCGLVKG